MAPYRYPVFASVYFRVVRNQPVKTINEPKISPIIIPILTFFIRMPITNPIIIAKMKAISPLLTEGLELVAIKILFSYSVQLYWPAAHAPRTRQF
jgi:hypothetical protein